MTIHNTFIQPELAAQFWEDIATTLENLARGF
jgi:hypothetical protein